MLNNDRHPLAGSKIWLTDISVNLESCPGQSLPPIKSILLLMFTSEKEISSLLPEDFVQSILSPRGLFRMFIGMPFDLKEFAFFLKSDDDTDVGFAWFSHDELRGVTAAVYEETYLKVRLALRSEDGLSVGAISLGLWVVPSSVGKVRMRKYMDAIGDAAMGNPDTLIYHLLDIDGDSTLKRYLLKFCGDMFFSRCYEGSTNSEDLAQALLAFGCIAQYNEQTNLVNEDITERLTNKSLDGDLHRKALTMLGYIYALFFIQDRSKPKYLSTAISLLRHVIPHFPNDSPDLPVAMTDLGYALTVQFQHHDNSRLDSIIEAISLHRKAIGMVPNPDILNLLPRILCNFGDACLSQSAHLHDLEPLSQGIQALQRSLELTPESDTQWIRRVRLAARAYEQRFLFAKDPADIRHAINLLEHSITLLDPDNFNIAAFKSDITRARMRLYDETRNVCELDVAIYKQKEMITASENQACTKSHQYLLFQQLGELLQKRFQRTLTQGDFDEALGAFETAVSVTTDGHHNRQFALMSIVELHCDRLEFTNPKDTVTAGTRFAEALDAAEAWQSSGNSDPRQKMVMTLLLALLGRDSVTKGLAMSMSALDMLPEIAGPNQRIEIRHKQLASLSSTMWLGVIQAIVRDELCLAVELMERVRCWVWRQINHLRSPVDDIRSHNNELADRIERITRQLEEVSLRSTSGSSFTYPSIHDIHKQDHDDHQHLMLAKEWDRAVEEVRAIPGFQEFLKPPTISRLLEGLPDGGPVVLFSISVVRCDAIALVAHVEEPILIPLLMDLSDIEKHSRQIQGYLSSKRVRSRGFGDLFDEDIAVEQIQRAGGPRAQAGFMADMLRRLWTNIVKPVLDALAFNHNPSARRRIWWCTSGPLAFLPLHAAGIYSDSKVDCLLDYAISSYIPNVSNLIEKVHRKAEPSNRLLLIAQADAPDLTPIPATLEEVAGVADCVREAGGYAVVLDGADATIDAVKSSISSCGSIHLACHGIQQLGEPLKSGFELRDGRLNLSEIIKQNMPHAELAFLSACQTSVGDETIPDEMVHLAAGMLAAGYRSVVGTAWSISDAHGPRVAKDFYAHLTENREGFDSTQSAIALDCAVQKLRKRVGDSEAGLLTWVPYVHFGA